MKDIETPADVRTLVDAFYAKVNQEELLAPVFNEIARVDWAAHLPTMYRFWESMLFRTGGYEGAPFPKHAVLPVEQAHFERWLTLFVETVTHNFSGPKSEQAENQALCIADTFARRMGVLTDPATLTQIRWPSSTNASAGNGLCKGCSTVNPSTIECEERHSGEPLDGGRSVDATGRPANAHVPVAVRGVC